MTREPGQLVQVLAWLFAASRTDGKQRTHVCSNGLQLRVGTAEGEFIALSRKAGESNMLEAQTVAAKAGWELYSADWQNIGGGRYLVVRPDVAETAEDPDLDPDDTDPPSAEIKAFLTDPVAPWRHRTFSAQMHEAREDAVRAMNRQELREEWGWLNTKWKPQLQDYQRARLRQALAEATRGPAP